MAAKKQGTYAMASFANSGPTALVSSLSTETQPAKDSKAFFFKHNCRQIFGWQILHQTGALACVKSVITKFPDDISLKKDLSPRDIWIQEYLTGLYTFFVAAFPGIYQWLSHVHSLVVGFRLRIQGFGQKGPWPTKSEDTSRVWGYCFLNTNEPLLAAGLRQAWFGQRYWGSEAP